MVKQFLLALALIAACAPAFAQDRMDSGAGPQQKITFLDSKLFDTRLSAELDSGKSVVEVEVSGRVPLSSIPGRIDRWITNVAERGGAVEIKEAGPEVRTRGLFDGLFSMVFTAFEKMSEERLYAPSRQYNATLLYRKDANGDTVISKIIFTKKNP